MSGRWSYSVKSTPEIPQEKKKKKKKKWKINRACSITGGGWAHASDVIVELLHNFFKKN